MNRYGENRALLSRRFPGLWNAFSRTELLIDVETSKTGLPVPVVTIGGRKLSVHSRIDPVREAERFIEGPAVSGHDLFVVFGFGFAYHVEELLAKLGRDVNLLVIERFPALVDALIRERDLSRLFSDERFFLLIDPDDDSLAGILRGKSSRSVTFLYHRGSVSLDQPYYENIGKRVRSYFSTKEVNIATLAKFERTWGSNIARNLGTYLVTQGAGIFYGRFTGYNAVVVGAGPSLESMIPWLKSVEKSMVIIAVDTAYRYLLSREIFPHFCLAVDPQVINARYLEGLGETTTVLVAESMVHPALFRYFKGRTVTTGIAFDLLKWIERTVGAKGEITHGGSVSTNAADFARRLGVKTVYLAGQDLAFTGGRAHVRGAYFEEQLFQRTTRIFTAEMHNRRQLFALPPLYVPAINGGTVHTNQKMMVFLNWFGRQVGIPLVNTGTQGALIPGVMHTPFTEIFSNEGETDIGSLITRIYNENVPGNDAVLAAVRGLLVTLDAMLGELEGLTPKLAEGVDYSTRLLGELQTGNDQGKIGYYLKKLAEVDRQVEGSKKIKDMISFTTQRVIHTITEGYETGEDEGDGRESVAARSRFLYQGLLEGAQFNRKIIGRMKTMITPILNQNKS